MSSLVIPSAVGSDDLALARENLKCGRFEEAERICRRVLRDHPDQPEAFHLLGRVAYEVGQYGLAAALARKAIAIDPARASYHDNLGLALLARGNAIGAASSLRRALEIEPDAATHVNLAAAQLALDQPTEAEASARRALALRPGFVEAMTNLGTALLTQGRQAEAEHCHRRALAVRPDFIHARSCLIFASHYLPTNARRDLLAEARDWGLQHAEPLVKEILPHTNAPDPDRRLRIGYVSADFRHHPVGYYLQSVLPAHDRARVEVFCYANQGQEDDVTTSLRSAADCWRSIRGLDDAAAAELIRADAVDILVDLSGHTAGNRLLVFARKPAPVQVTWFKSSTGVRTIDYLLADRIVCPEGEEDLFLERVVRLPGSFLCAPPLDPSIEVDALPALSRGHITFGSFNNIVKNTPQVVALWAEILRAMPDARLCLKTPSLDTPGVRERHLRLFAENGVSPERIDLIGRSPRAAHIAAYAELDIALDPFPFNGGITTMETLWMGVPTIALRGDGLVSRMGASILSVIGLDDLIAESPLEYVDKAVALAGDLPRLRALRAGLRQRMAQSPLCDGPGFTRTLEAAYREMWQAWCQSHSSPPHTIV
jgi:predicted O-linked N-acetylglucosamine transferase (SPINDLY family)